MLRLLLSVIVAALPALAYADSPLKRLTLRQDLLGFEAVGRLDMEGGFCSGALIASDMVLTAAHCLIDKRTGARRDPREMTFRAGFRDGDAIAEARGLRAVMHPGYRPEDNDGLRQLRSDVALLQLAEPIPLSLVSPFGVAKGPGTGGKVTVVSYARGRTEAPQWQRRCGVTLRAQGAVVMSCDTNFGSSGAPVFDMSSGRPQIVSLISRGTREDGKIVVFGMELQDALAETQAALRGGRGVWPEAGFTPRRLTLGGGAINGGGATSGARFVKP